MMRRFGLGLLLLVACEPNYVPVTQKATATGVVMDSAIPPETGWKLVWAEDKRHHIICYNFTGTAGISCVHLDPAWESAP